MRPEYISMMKIFNLQLSKATPAIGVAALICAACGGGTPLDSDVTSATVEANASKENVVTVSTDASELLSQTENDTAEQPSEPSVGAASAIVGFEETSNTNSITSPTTTVSAPNNQASETNESTTSDNNAEAQTNSPSTPVTNSSTTPTTTPTVVPETLAPVTTEPSAETPPPAPDIPAPENVTPEPEPEPDTTTPEPEPEPEATTSEPVSQVYSGQLMADESLGAIQCLGITNTNQSFGDVTGDDWRNWLENYTYSLRPEHLATGVDGDKIYFRQKLEPTSIGSHHVQAGSNLNSARTYRLSQSLYFENDFDWGGSNEGGKVGFGLGGGSAPSGGLLQTDGYTLRLMWRGNGDGSARLVAYSYAADRGQHLPYGDDYPLVDFVIPTDTWFNVTIEVRTNSSLNANDGTLRIWVDNELKLERNNIEWQTSGDQPAVQELVYTTFYGGNDSSWSPSQTTYIRFADACWAPVYTNDGSLQNDPLIEGTPIANPPLRVDAEKTARGNIISTLKDLEVMLPSQFSEVNSQLYATLDNLNSALTPTLWLNNDAVALRSDVFTNLEDAVSELSSIASNTQISTHINEQANIHSSRLIDTSLSLIVNAQNTLTTQLTNAGCADSSSMNCLLATQELQRSEGTLYEAQQDGYSYSDKMRLAVIAWLEVLQAHDNLNQ